jgi:hypothetical protein
MIKVGSKPSTDTSFLSCPQSQRSEVLQIMNDPLVSSEGLELKLDDVIAFLPELKAPHNRVTPDNVSLH